MLEDTPRTFIGATTFQVTGMTCGHCQRAVTEEISRIPGIQGVTVDLATGSVTVTATQPVDRTDVAHAVGEAGYTLIPQGTTMTTATSSSSTCTLDIGGMTCASCVRHVEKALSRIDGVNSAEVNLATEPATVSFAPQAAGLSELTAAVAAAGYTATPRHAADAQPAPRGD